MENDECVDDDGGVEDFIMALAEDMDRHLETADDRKSEGAR